MKYSPAPIRVAIVEDAPEVRASLRILLSGSPGFACIQCHSSAEEAIKKIPCERLDVVLMDVNLPGLSGIECVARLHALGIDVPVLMLTVHDDEDVIFPALEAGACGYLLKETPPAEILLAIEQVHAGGAPMSSVIARKVVQSFRQSVVPEQAAVQLSHREIEILSLLAKGYRYKEISDVLELSERTINSHTRRIYERLHVHSRIAAVAKFKQLNKEQQG
ncbi:MAG: response regulator transcription factor [Verrucomicrobia bacterium]|nr:response regulator transcription factor [Verrucomicrobiota bacterium]